MRKQSIKTMLHTQPLQKITEIKKNFKKNSNFLKSKFLIGLEARLVNIASAPHTSKISLIPYSYDNISWDPHHAIIASLDVRLGYLLVLENKNINFLFNALYSYARTIDGINFSSYYRKDKDPFLYIAISHKIGGEVLAILESFYFGGGISKDINSKIDFHIENFTISKKFNSWYPSISAGIMYKNDFFIINLGGKYEWSIDDTNYFSTGYSIMTLGISFAF